MIYKKYFYKVKEKEIDYLFLEFLVNILGGIDHPVLIEE